MNQINEYAKYINANAEVLAWLNTAGASAIKKQKTSESELEHILDYLVSSAAPSRLLKMSFVDAKRKSEAWSAANQKKGRDLTDGPDDIELLHDFGDGTRIVKLLTSNALKREGFFMSHCAGSYSVSTERMIYSYRDQNNEPHATFEVNKCGGEIVQIKGKGNGAIHPKYIKPILAFLEAIGMNIRPSDMKNLGYHHLHKEHLDFIKSIPEAWKQVHEIRGEAYAF